MAKCKQTKKALLSSVIALILCCSMLIGTTFAWFTDSVESGNNIIQAGNLDVDLQYKKVVNGVETDWASVQGEDELFNPNALWEPGHVEVVYLKVSNLGSLALKYQLGVNVVAENPGINVDGEVFKLSDHLVFKAIEMPDALTTYTDREAAALAAGTALGLKDYNGVTKALDPKDAANDEDYVALIVYMPETVGNEANYRGTSIPSITLGINLYATQVEAENDSFGNDYDEDAWMPEMKVYNAQDLQTALNNGETNIVLENDIASDNTIVIPAPAANTYALRAMPNAVVINLNGHSLTTVDKNVVRNEGANLILKNGTISRSGTAGGYAINNVDGGLEVEGLTVVGGIYTSGPALTVANSNISQYLSGRHVIYAYNCEATIISGTFHNENSGNSALMAAGTSVFNINGGTFSIKDGRVPSNGNTWTSCLLDAKNTAKYNINGGTFNGGFRVQSNATMIINGGSFNDSVGSGYNVYTGGTVVINGGIFTDNNAANFAKKYVNAEQFKVVDNGNGTFIAVPKQENGNDLTLVSNYPGLFTDGTNYYVYDAQGLISMNNFWKANWSANHMWGRSYNIMADINATGYTWNEAYVVVGNNENNGFVFDGHGYTITGLTINGGLFSGTPNGGNKPNNPGYMKNITFDGAKVVGDHFTGVLWSNVYNELVVENVTVINSEITGKCNVAALIGGTSVESGDASVKFINCVVKNNVITAEGKAGQDPNGAYAFLSRAFGNTAVIFEGTNIAEDNTITNGNGLVGGGIYGYTTWENGGFAGTGSSNSFINWQEVEKVTVSTAEELKEAFKATVSDTTAVINITADIQLAAGESWTPLEINPYISGTVNKVIVNGNGHTISGLNAPLFGDVHFGGTIVEINDLTLADCEIISAAYNDGLGVFIAYADSCDSITLKNCHLIDSKIEATTDFTGVGGLVGFSSSPLTIEDCSVVNTTVIGADQSAGAIAGHVYNANITNAKVQGCTIKGERVDKSGYVVGTINKGGAVVTTHAECANNTVFDVANSNTIYGRFVPNGTGTLTLNGVVVE